MKTALNNTVSKRNGFELLFDMLTSQNPNEARKASKILKSWTKATKKKFIHWYHEFMNSDFVSGVSIQQAEEEVNHLINSAQ